MLLRRTAVRLSAAAMCVALYASNALAGDGRALLKYLPKDAPGVLVVNMEQLGKSALYQELMKSATSSPEVKKALDDARALLGADPLTAIKTVVVAFPSVQSGQDALLAFEPNFDAERTAKKAVSEGKAKLQETYNGAALYAGTGAGQGMMTVLGGQIVTGEAAAVKKAVDQFKKKGPSAEKNADLMKRLTGVATTNDLIFAMKPSAEMRKTMNGEAQKMEGVNGGLDFEKGVGAKFDVTFDSPKTATDTVAQIKGGLTGLGSNPQAAMFGADILAKKLNVTAAGKDVKLSLALDEADVARLKTTLAMLAAMSGAMGGQQGGAPGMMPPQGR